MWAEYFSKYNRSSLSCNFGKILLCWKNLGMLLSFRFWDTIFSTLFNTYVYRRVSFSAVDIIISKEEEIFGPTILMMVRQYLFFIWRFGCLEAEQKPVRTSLNRNCQKLSCTETRIAQPPKPIDRSSMWHMKDNGQGYLFCKRVFIYLSSC